MTARLEEALAFAARLAGAPVAPAGGWTDGEPRATMAPAETPRMARFWVCGGEYADTTFTTLAGGAEELRLGPFESYARARAEWRARAMATADNAHVRFRIEKEGGESYWVVGGVYTDTGFATIVEGREEDRLGPFESYAEARDIWRARAMATADDAHARYRIERV